jgi:hypothetical protein
LTRAGCPIGRSVMLDAVFITLGFGFLAVTVLYVVACDRL